MLVAVLLSSSTWLAAAQAVVFALGAFVGLRAAPYAAIYRTVIARRLAPPTQREAAAPLRFAQGVGFVFLVIATIGFGTGLTVLGLLATGCALAAAALNAVFGICLGCEVYLRLPRRLRRALTA